MFGYISLLVEEEHFQTIEVYFLIVGHTHASIDQYFSVLARDIYRSHFIGSPLALAALLAREKRDQHNFSGNSWKGDTTYKVKPLFVRHIQVVHDIRKALQPHLNTTIKYYPIPHK